MGRAALWPVTGILLIAPTVLAFFSGGYFDEPRLWAAIVTWVLVLLIALTNRAPLPRSRAGRAAVGGLALVCVWSGISLTWAPLAGPAMESVTRLVLYVGALLAAIALLRDRRAMRAVEPVLAAGAVLLVGYGMLGRLLPGILHLSSSWSSAGRLEQPISYWNAEGALAAVGAVLCVRLAGDGSCPPIGRALAASACGLLGAGIYLTYSRGAIAAGLIGLVVLLAAAPDRAQLRAARTGLAAAVMGAASAAVFPAVASLHGSHAERVSRGAIVLVLLLAVTVAGGAIMAFIARAERNGRLPGGRLGFARRLPTVAVAAVLLTGAGLVAGGLTERGGAAELVERQGASRLVSVSSRRYQYWRTGLDAVARRPLRGTGAGGFRVEWLRERPASAPALEVHSLELEMAVELGAVGLLAFLTFLFGVGAAALTALRRHPELATGPVAACTAWLLHATIDWDWQLPAVTLPALVLAGGIVAISEASAERPAPPALPAEDAQPEPRPMLAAAGPVSAARARPAGQGG